MSRLRLLLLGVAAVVGWLLLPVGAASASPVTASPVTASPVTSGTATTAGAAAAAPRLVVLPAAEPDGPEGPQGADDSTVTVELDGLTDKPSSSVAILITITLLSLLPAILLSCTCFTKILVVLGLTRNALGLQQMPPNQVLVGLALFLSVFIMGPTLSEMNDAGVQPYLDGDKSSSQAFDDGVQPLRTFMLAHTDDDEIELLTNVADREVPASREDVGLSTLIPAFMLTELKQAFIIGFIIFIPFLVIDIVVSGALMALGMMMMPPVMVSLPFKLLLFVMVNGWALIIEAVVGSYG